MTRLALTLMILILLTGCDQAPETHSFTFEIMGTVASARLELPSSLTADEAENLVRGSFDEVNNQLSTWQKNSEISRLNRAPADSAFVVSPLMRTCLLTSRMLHEQSGGAFDPTAESLMRLWGFYRREGRLPSTVELDQALADLGQWTISLDTGAVVKTKPGTRFDLGGIAKGLAVDIAAMRLQQAGVVNGLIDLGGNLFCLGGAQDRTDWRVGIKNPRNKSEHFASVTVSGMSVATSGSYERFVVIDGHEYGHIMNPATGRPAEGLLSVTVIAPEGILADGLSTTLFVLGPQEALAFVEKQHPQVEAILVYPGLDGKKDQVVATPGLEGRLHLVSEFESKMTVVFR